MHHIITLSESLKVINVKSLAYTQNAVLIPVMIKTKQVGVLAVKKKEGISLWKSKVKEQTSGEKNRTNKRHGHILL